MRTPGDLSTKKKTANTIKNILAEDGLDIDLWVMSPARYPLRHSALERHDTSKKHPL